MSSKNYGTAAAGAGGDPEFNLENTYYVKERSLSRKERCSKLLLVLLPILLALLLLGGVTYYFVSHILVRGGGGKHGEISVTYPSSKGSSSTVSRPGSFPSPTEKAPAPAPAPKSHSSSGSSACSSNSKCADLGLIGDCCPTKQGVTLGCCD